jgi:hypothetical protein
LQTLTPGPSEHRSIGRAATNDLREYAATVPTGRSRRRISEMSAHTRSRRCGGVREIDERASLSRSSISRPSVALSDAPAVDPLVSQLNRNRCLSPIVTPARDSPKLGRMRADEEWLERVAPIRLEAGRQNAFTS